jgi:hypothetical protein
VAPDRCPSDWITLYMDPKQQTPRFREMMRKHPYWLDDRWFSLLTFLAPWSSNLWVIRCRRERRGDRKSLSHKAYTT